MNAQPLADLTPYFVATCGASSTQNPSKLATSNHKGRRPANWGCGGREFEPRRSDHFPPFFVLSVAHPIFAPFGVLFSREHL